MKPLHGPLTDNLVTSILRCHVGSFYRIFFGIEDIVEHRFILENLIYVTG